VLRDRLHGFYDAVVRGASIAGLDGRLAVYREAYQARLADALAEQHPALAAILGRERFGDVVEGYVAAHPPASPDLGDAGDRLPQYLAADPALAELATLERLFLDLFVAPDATPLAANDVTAEGPLGLVPASALLVTSHDVGTAWATHTRPARETTRLLVWRQRGTVWHRRLDESEHRALALVQAGGTLAALAESMESVDEIAALLAQWLDEEILGNNCSSARTP
jgi:hypothetical protein